MMKNAAGSVVLLRLIFLAALSWLQNVAVADTRSDELKRCLQDFGGIEWKLPYMPPVSVRSCASKSVNFDTSLETVEGRHSLELIGELTLGPDNSDLSSGERSAAVHNVIYVHFDALFRRHGYRRIELGHGDAQTRRDLRALMMLSGGSASEESIRNFNRIEAMKPPIPYVNLARYVQSIGGKEMSLTYKLNSGNTWLIILEPAQHGLSKLVGDSQ